MHMHRLRDHIATALGLAAVACNPTKPIPVAAPVTSNALSGDAALPRAPGKIVGLPPPPTCQSFEYVWPNCAPSGREVPDDHYPAPYAACAVRPNFSATETDKKRATSPEACCYADCVTPYEGRPFRSVDGTASVASARQRTDWQASHVVPKVVPSAERSERWLKAALAEHASIAAFSQISLQLLALGAPASLLAAAHRAALDEIRHAEITFALAGAYANGAQFGPAEFCVTSAVTTQSLRAVALDALIDGCVGEAVSALAMADEAETEPNAHIATLIRNIVSDEERHAVLAWQIVRWALSKEPQLLPVLEAPLARIAQGDAPQATLVREVAMPILHRLGSVFEHRALAT